MGESRKNSYLKKMTQNTGKLKQNSGKLKQKYKKMNYLKYMRINQYLWIKLGGLDNEKY